MWIWAVLPIAVWHERLALQDPFVTAALASAIAMVTAASRHNARNRSAWLAGAGVCFGVSFLLKISTLLTLPWLGLLYCGIQSHFSRPIFERRVASFIVGAMAPVMTLGPHLLRLGSGLSRYEALPKLESGNVARAAMDRLETWVGWYSGYGGWALFLLLGVALAMTIILRLRLPLVCAVSWALSLVISSFFLNNGYARYTLPDHLPLVFFLGLSLGSARQLTWRALATAAVAIAIGGWGRVALHIGVNPARAAVPRADIEQYVTGSWSGRGVKEVHRFLVEYADRNNTGSVVLVHRFLRPGCYGMLLTQLADPRVGVVPFTVYTREELSTAVGLVQRRLQPDSRLAIFLLYEGSLYPAQSWLDQPGAPTRLVFTTNRGNGEHFSLYRVDEIPASSAPPIP
jgi:uncharacterized membrane protein